MNKRLNPRNPRRPECVYDVYEHEGDWYYKHASRPEDYGFLPWREIGPKSREILGALSIGGYTAFVVGESDKPTGFTRVASKQ